MYFSSFGTGGRASIGKRMYCHFWLQWPKMNVLIFSNATSCDFSTAIGCNIQTIIASLEKSSQVDIYGKEVQLLINKAIEAMPPKVRKTYLQSRVEKLKNKEIAQLQGIGLSTVEFRLACAMRIMRRYLKDYIYFLLWFFIQ